MTVRKLEAGIGTLVTSRGSFDGIRYTLPAPAAAGETPAATEGTIWRRGAWLDAAFDASRRGRLQLEGGETIEIEAVSFTGETARVRVLPS